MKFYKRQIEGGKTYISSVKKEIHIITLEINYKSYSLLIKYVNRELQFI